MKRLMSWIWLMALWACPLWAGPLMTSGVGNLLGYLGTGWWFSACTRPTDTRWPLFWGALAVTVGLVMIYFLTAYHGQASRLLRSKKAQLP